MIHTVTPPARPHGTALPATRLRRARVHRPHVWRLYGGWWDGNPATLKPAPERALALELAELAGGAGVLADRALALHRRRPATRPTGGAHGRRPRTTACGWPGTWPSWPGWPRPDDPGVGEVRRTVFTRRADAATSTMAHGVFSWAARESGAAVRDGPPDPVGGRAVATPLNREFARRQAARLSTSNCAARAH